jgi:hypothetical protein
MKPSSLPLKIPWRSVTTSAPAKSQRDRQTAEGMQMNTCIYILMKKLHVDCTRGSGGSLSEAEAETESADNARARRRNGTEK